MPQSHDSWLMDPKAYEQYAGDDPPSNPLDPQTERKREKEEAKNIDPLERVSLDTHGEFNKIAGMGMDNKHKTQGGTILVNLTPHEMTLIYPDGRMFILKKKEGPVPRVETKEHLLGYIGLYFPIKWKRMGEVDNLPPKIDGIYYIVSSLVAQKARRDDFLVPIVQRDEDGHPIGATGFYKIGEET